ncbi:MAG: pyridoxamine 5'-phosphate oxidase family protein, partial [Pseudomonadota bacterium]
VFWASSPKSYHSRQIENNPNVSVSIYDQNMPQGTGFGLRLNGRAQILDEISDDFIRGYELLKSKALNMPETKAELLAKDGLRKIYMLEIQDVRANAAIEYEGKSGWQDVSHIAPDVLRLAADN